MTVVLTKEDLRTVYISLARLLPPGSLPRTPEEVVEIDRVRALVEVMIKEHAPAPERGRRVFAWRIPREQAPTLNTYAFMKSWQRVRLRKELDDQLRSLIEDAWPNALVNGRIRRWVRVTRFSTQATDEASADVLGGKMAIDALVRCGVLVEDDTEFVHREALSRKTQRGNTHVLVECFEMGAEARGRHADDEPKDAQIAQVIRQHGKFTQAITGQSAVPKRSKRGRSRPARAAASASNLRVRRLPSVPKRR